MVTVLCALLDISEYMFIEQQQAIECLKCLVQKKFFASTKDHFALVVFGSEGTDNPMASQPSGGFSNISVLYPLGPISWDLLRLLNSEENFVSSQSGDVIEAIHVCVHHLNEKCRAIKNVREKRILLLTNLISPSICDQTMADSIIKDLREGDIQLSLIGSELHSQYADSDPLAPGPSWRPPVRNASAQHPGKLRPALSLISQIWGQVAGEAYSFSEALPALSLFESRAVAQRPWRVDLQVGGDLSLPVEGFTQVKEAQLPRLQLLKQPPIDIVTKYSVENATQDLQDDGDPAALDDSVSTNEVHASEVVRGYRYGATMVPFSDEDMTAVKQTGEMKCLSVITFTQAENVPHHIHIGDSVLVFVANPSAGSQVAQAFAALVQAMYELNAVALVRRVFNRASTPRLGVLTPEIRGAQISLMYTALAFADNLRSVEFPPLPVSASSNGAKNTSGLKGGHPPSAAQLETMNRFVDSMLLGSAPVDVKQETDNTAQPDDEKGNGDVPDVHPERVPNPWIQRFFSHLRNRGLNIDYQWQQQQVEKHLSASHLPGLEAFINRLEGDRASGASPRNVEPLSRGDEIPSPAVEVLHARNQLVSCLPPLIWRRADKKKADSEEHCSGVEASTAKRRRLLMQQFFNLPDTSHTTDSSDAGSQQTPTDVGVSDPVQDFQRLLAQGDPNTACERLSARVLQLVTDPFLGSLLRPKAVACLRAYRSACLDDQLEIGDRHVMATAYNLFVTQWSTTEEIQQSDDAEGDNDDDLARRQAMVDFWREVISSPEFAPLSGNHVPGFSSTEQQAVAVIKGNGENGGSKRKHDDGDAVKSSTPAAENTDQLLEEMD